MHPAEHIVASTRNRARPLIEPEPAAWLWRHLLEALPQALSLVFMPDHIHLMAGPGALPTTRRILAAFTARFGPRFDLCAPQPANSPAIATRQIRYGFLNPVRAQLVDDPYAWPWSTLRDLVGATAPIHTPLHPLARMLGQRPIPLLHALTQHPTPRCDLPETVPLNTLLHSVAAALRIPVHQVPTLRLGRRLTVQLAHALPHGPATPRLASALRVDPRTVRRLRTPLHPNLHAAKLCLADPRFRQRLP